MLAEDLTDVFGIVEKFFLDRGLILEEPQTSVPYWLTTVHMNRLTSVAHILLQPASAFPCRHTESLLHDIHQN